MSGYGTDGMGKDSSKEMNEYKQLRRPKPCNNESGDGYNYHPNHGVANPSPWAPVWSNDGSGDPCAQAMATMSLADSFTHPTYLGEAYTTPVRSVIQPEKSVLSPDAPVFVPRSLQTQFQAEQTIVNEVPGGDLEEGMEEYVSQQLEMTLRQVTLNPGKFDTLVPSMVDEMGHLVIQSPQIAKPIIDILFEQSVLDRNFRYNGARICALFCKQPDEKHTFRQVLLQRCQQEHNDRNQMLMEPEFQERLRGFTHFLGELFVNIEFTSNNVSQKIDQLGKALLELFDTLLQQPNPDNLKCVAQVLKLSGGSLEDFANKTGETPRMDKLFEKIHNFTTNSDVTKLMQEMFKNVEALRACNWGRVQAACNSTNSEPAFDYPVNQPVLYGPDGIPLSLEEAQFLESNNGFPDYEEDYEYQQPGVTWSTSESANDEELDNEIAVAYEEYLKELSREFK